MSDRHAPSLLERVRAKSGAMTLRPEVDCMASGAVDLRVREFARWVQHVLPADGSVLDVGCWTGGLASALEPSRRHLYTGVDIKPALSAIEHARLCVPEARFEVIDSEEQLPFPSGSFDLVTLAEVIEHVPSGHEPRLLAEAARVLRTGGCILLTTPLSNIFNPLDPAWFVGHRHYTLSRLRALADGAGLVVDDAFFTGGIWTSLDMDLFYFSKHVLRQPYARTRSLTKLVEREYEKRSHAPLATSIWCRLSHRHLA